jgi:hypothetical protein
MRARIDELTTDFDGLVRRDATRDTYDDESPREIAGDCHLEERVGLLG